ncbi:MAG: hydrogenase formation protein HypD [Eubacteriales bacterium]|nr:hydrogenase formation protein HypD [Eubacteriales bacterium]
MEENKKEMTDLELIQSYDGPPVRIMEVCGTHTHEIFKLGVRQILPEQVTLISGPGCPVCVTPVDFIDKAMYLALEKGVTVCTFGDLIRVPGTKGSLADARAKGGKVQMVYSPMDACDYAAEHPEEEVVFLSVGFETTTPASCLAAKKAMDQGLKNFSLLVANKTMPAAYQALKDSVDVYLYPGHVNAIMGTDVCEKLAEEGVSGVVTGFSAKQLLRAFATILREFPKGKPFFANCYQSVVKKNGSPGARRIMEEWMEDCDTQWRGLGVIPHSGLRLKEKYQAFDAEIKYQVPKMEGRINPACRCGEVLQGKCLPTDCKVFGTACNPQHPIGACMVSGEGACSAYYQYSLTK